MMNLLFGEAPVVSFWKIGTYMKRSTTPVASPIVRQTGHLLVRFDVVHSLVVLARQDADHSQDRIRWSRNIKMRNESPDAVRQNSRCVDDSAADNVDHPPVVLPRKHLGTLAPDERLELADSRTVNISRQERHAHLLGQRHGLHLLDEPVALRLQSENMSDAREMPRAIVPYGPSQSSGRSGLDKPWQERSDRNAPSRRAAQRQR